MKKRSELAIAVMAGVASIMMITAEKARSAEKEADLTNRNLEAKIWKLLDDDKAVFVSLSESDFRALGEGFDLPDGGTTVTHLAQAAPGGAFDPRDVGKIPAATLGYKADWVVERYKRYGMDWDITGLRLTSLNPDAKKYPWFIIMNGGAANFYELRRSEESSWLGPIPGPKNERDDCDDSWQLQIRRLGRTDSKRKTPAGLFVGPGTPDGGVRSPQCAVEQ